jgi:hypothetical protein
MRKHIFLNILAVIILASCSVNKRVYRKGYYVDWAHGKREVREHKIISDQIIVKQNKPVVTEEVVSVNKVEVVSANVQKNDVSFILKTNKTQLPDEECGDLINFRKGRPVKAKVIEITPIEVKYKRCDDLNGPLFVVMKNDIYSIKYLSGREDHFFTEYNQSPGMLDLGKKHHPMALTVTGFAIASCLFGPLTAIICLLLIPSAKRAVLKSGDKYDKEGSLDLIQGSAIASWIVVGITLLFAFFIAALLLTI